MVKFAKLALLTTTVMAALSAQAHRAWILPDATVLSSDSPWVTFDAAISNEIFYSDYHAMSLDGIKALNPQGKEVALQNTHSGKVRSVFDLELKESGTYKILSTGEGLFAGWQENGERKRWRGTRENFEKEVPADPEGLEITEFTRRVETFVTAGAPTTEIFKGDAKAGLVLVPETHPNDLFAGEPANFSLMIDGQPAANVDVEIIPAGTRYRDQQNAIHVTTDKAGKFTVNWPEAGRYWLGADYEDDKGSFRQGAKRRASYMATLEVLPL